jgi:uncharacterized membrane protein
MMSAGMSGVFHGFLLSEGEFTAIDWPGTSVSTFAYTITARGEVAGTYQSAGVNHGFLWSRGELTSIDFPGADQTHPSGINDRGDVVGEYIRAGVHHGFLLTAGRMVKKPE